MTVREVISKVDNIEDVYVKFNNDYFVFFGRKNDVVTEYYGIPSTKKDTTRAAFGKVKLDDTEFSMRIEVDSLFIKVPCDFIVSERVTNEEVA